MSHTPGPWEFRGHWIYPVGSHDDLGRVSESYLRSACERAANGRLIAQAPTMLAALKDALGVLDVLKQQGDPLATPLHEQIRAILHAVDGDIVGEEES